MPNSRPTEKWGTLSPKRRKWMKTTYMTPNSISGLSTDHRYPSIDCLYRNLKSEDTMAFSNSQFLWEKISSMLTLSAPSTRNVHRRYRYCTKPSAHTDGSHDRFARLPSIFITGTGDDLVVGDILEMLAIGALAVLLR